MQPTTYNQLLNLPKAQPQVVVPRDESIINHEIWLDSLNTKWLIAQLQAERERIMLSLASSPLAEEKVLRALSAELGTIVKTINLIMDRKYE